MTTNITTPVEEPVDTGLDDLLNTHFAGKVVRKDLTKLIKEGANVPVYVLEYLLGMYCASNDEAVIQSGLVNVKRILTENYVRPDEAEKVKSKVRESGTYKVIDKVTVKLNEKRDVYEALLSNLGVKNAEVSDSYVRQFEKLLVGGIWCIVTLKYHFEEDQKGSPFTVTELKPIQMPNMDMAALFEARKAFTDEQWIDALIRSTGMEPSQFKERVKWHLLARMVPLVENNYNFCELGPRGTGKTTSARPSTLESNRRYVELTEVLRAKIRVWGRLCRVADAKRSHRLPRCQSFVQGCRCNAR
jgi:ATP-dependent Lon protease